MWKDHVIEIYHNKSGSAADDDLQLGLDYNWDRIFIMSDKFSGTLRYTLKQNDATNGIYRSIFENLDHIEIQEAQIAGYYVAECLKKAKQPQGQTVIPEFKTTPLSCLKKPTRRDTGISEEEEEEDEEEFKTVAKIRCLNRVPLQWIQNALEEARTDFKEIGLPLTFRVHDKENPSLLSIAVHNDGEDAKSKSKVSMAGVSNLLGLLLIITNIKHVITSLNEHGFALTEEFQKFVDSKIYFFPENYQTIAGLLTLPAFTVFSFWIEILAANRAPKKLVFFFIVLNISTLLLFPIILSFQIEADFIGGNLLMLYSVSTCLKLISFHHVMHDVRGLVLRVIEAKKQGRTLKPSKVEGTILGVHPDVYEVALTYPRCLSVTNFTRFMVAPTFCYQVVFPLHEKRDSLQILKRLLQILLSLFLLSFMFYQHILPVARKSVPYFEEGDYFNILVCVLEISVSASYSWVVMFFLIFHAWTNFFAEVTRFSDRRFYSDWWNAGNLGEYWRKWNYPIHNWLVRHVHYPMIRRGVSNDVSRFVTFLVSAIAHEYVVVGTFRVFNMLAFTFMLVNAPLMQLQRSLRDKVSKTANNTLFWLCYTVLGQPLAGLICYYQAVKKM